MWTFDSISNMFYSYKLGLTFQQSSGLISLYTSLVIVLNFVMGFLQFRGVITKVNSMRLASVVGVTLYFGMSFLPLYHPSLGYVMVLF